MGIEVIYAVGAALLLLALIWELTGIATVVRESARRATLTTERLYKQSGDPGVLS